MKAEKIYAYLNGLFPENTACDFDNVGFLVGDYKMDVDKVLISLDCNLSTIQNAKSNNCKLIITHHPVIFDGLKNVLSGSVVYELIKNGISVISMHTNLDIADGGVTDSLCKAIGLKNITPFKAFDGFLLREGTISPTKAEKFAKHLKNVLGGNVKFTNGDNDINNVLVCSGSGGEFITEAITCGFDALVTSEVKHHQFLMAADNNISLFDAGHFNTEDIVLEPLKNILSEKFKEVTFITDHTNLIKYC